VTAMANVDHQISPREPDQIGGSFGIKPEFSAYEAFLMTGLEIVRSGFLQPLHLQLGRCSEPY
jgi:hypothetical protein